MVRITHVVCHSGLPTHTVDALSVRGHPDRNEDTTGCCDRESVGEAFVGFVLAHSKP